MGLAARIRAEAAALGFTLCGLTRAEPSPRLAAYEAWIEAGMQGTMGYLARPDRRARRRDLNVILPGVRSIIVVGLDYHAFSVPADVLNDPARGRIAAYAWGFDYHEVMAARLETLAEWLNAEAGPLAHRIYVDTGALLERDHGQAAGMGFTGKNTLLIHPRRGSFFFLGEILTTRAFDEYDSTGRESMCGRCTRCQSACPTDAFPRPYVLDARRCIAYLTIEHKGGIDPALRPQMGNWVMGCDVCQDVCPFNRFAVPTGEIAFQPVDIERAAPPLIDLLALDEAGFRARFAGSAVMRLGRDRLVRNACIAAGNGRDRALAAPLETLLHDSSALVRGHAGWGLWRIQGRESHPALHEALARESDSDARAEFSRILAAG